MTSPHKSKLKLISVVALFVLASVPFVGVSPASAGGNSNSRWQPLVDLAVDTDDPLDGAYINTWSRARDRRGPKTLTFIQLWNVDVDEKTKFGAHVHVGPCVEGDGGAAGPHYNAGGDPSEETEIWLDATVYRNSYGHSKLSRVDFVIPQGDAQSIVIHALPTDENGGAGARLACIDYTPPAPRR